MVQLLRMPEVAANTTEALLAEWLVEEAAEFAEADALATVETDKAAVDVAAEQGGVLVKTLVPSGTMVGVGAPIAVLAGRGEVVADLDAALAELGVAAPVAAPAAATGPLTTAEPAAAPVPKSAAPPPTDRREIPIGYEGRRVFASPLARKIASASGLTLSEIPGTGPHGRVLRRDVERFLAAPVAPAAPAPAAVPAPSAATPPVARATTTGVAAYDEVPHTRMRRAIAKRLTESKQTVPHFYLRAALRVDRLLALRAELNDGADVRVSVNDLLLRAVALAHRRVPEFNVTWAEDAVRRHHGVDVAVAVATETGLLTPVLRGVDTMPIRAVSAAVSELAGRAREGKLRPDELEGGSISVTNLGMFGTDEFAAIINPPHAAILAVGAARDEAVVDDGALAVGTVLRVTLAVDHRPVDGVVAARWLSTFRELVEKPVQILA